MINKTEIDLYTRIGQFIVNSIPEDGWHKAILYVEDSHGVIFYRGSFFTNNVKKSLKFPKPPLFDVIEELRKFTDENNYTRWNNFNFELDPNYNFNIDYNWSQELHDEKEKLAKGILD